MLKRLLIFYRIKKRHWYYGLLSLTIAFSLLMVNVVASYAFPWQDILIRGVQVFQLSTLSDAQEVQLGKQIRQELINSGKIRLENDRNLNNYLSQIGNRLVRFGSRPKLPYTFAIVRDNEVNAFATMGGFVYINTGLIKLADNEAQLASVIAHEIGHITGRHSVKQMRQEAIAQGVLTAAGLDQKKAVQIGVTLALELPHSRKHEYEADQLGLIMLTKAGYAPGAMVDFMLKLQKQGGNVPTILSTHPNSQNRAIALAQMIPRQSAYQGYGLDNEAYQRNIISIFKL